MKASEIADVLERMGWEEREIGGPHRYFNRPDGKLAWFSDEPDIGINEVEWFLDQHGVDKAEFETYYKELYQ